MRLVALAMLITSTLFAYSMDYDKNTTSIVRKMKVYEQPKWVAKIELTNGKKLFFESPKAMFEFYHQPGRWHEMGVKSENDYKDILITDFASLKPANAKGAFFVYGSNVTSPAGDDLVAFASYDDAVTFSKKHNGKRILNFKEVKLALINLLNGKI